MLHLVDGNEVKREAEKLATSLRRGKRIALQCDRAMEPDQIVAATVRELGSEIAVAMVPPSLDRVTHTILELASKLDSKDIEEIDDALRRYGSTETTLKLLEKALLGRTVIIERVENLAPSEHDEVAAALDQQRRDLAKWIRQRANLVTARQPLADWGAITYSYRVPDAAPVQLRNGEDRSSSVRWEECKDARFFGLSLALEALGIDPKPHDDAGLVADRSTESLRERLWDALPEGLTSLLKALAVHDRPLPCDVLARVPDFHQADYELGLGLALWRERAGRVVLDDGWSDWCDRALPRSEREETHRALAETFAHEVLPGDPSSRRAGLLIVEAQRHLLRVGEFERALSYARYGAELFVGLARDLSRERRFKESVALYERLLSKTDLLSPRLHAYAKHYLHYNRAHARPELEPVRETASGYDESLEGWPENAIFWSRDVRAWYVAGEPSRALDRLTEAKRVVPPHPDKDARLIARTARRLADFGFVLGAINVCGDYQPDTPRAREDLERLQKRLEDGWESDRLELPQIQPLVLLRRERFKIMRQQTGWRLVADRIGRSDRCDTPLESVLDFVKKVRAEVEAMLRALDRDLDDEQRERKQTLLSTVDVIASRLDAPGASTTWVYGKLERDDRGALWLVSGGNLVARYEIPSDLSGTLVVSAKAWLAEVESGPSGVPRGPVRALEQLSRQEPEAVWQQWRERLHS